MGPSGIMGHDGWAPYDAFEKALHQQCLAHLLRRCGHLLEVATRGAVRFPRAVKALHELYPQLEVRRQSDQSIDCASSARPFATADPCVCRLSTAGPCSGRPTPVTATRATTSPFESLSFTTWSMEELTTTFLLTMTRWMTLMLFENWNGK